MALADPAAVFDALPGVEGWSAMEAGHYRLDTSAPDALAPALTRALVAAGADVLAIAPTQHSLQGRLSPAHRLRPRGERRMSLSRRRIRAIAIKEVRTYRRTTSLVAAMAIIPLVFLIQPLISTFAVASQAAASIKYHHELLYLLAIPALVPATLAAYAIVGERQQGTLEPLLTTPIRREELLLAKALAVLIPSIAISYLVFAIYVVLVALFAHAGVASAFLAPVRRRGPDHLHPAARRLVDLGQHGHLHPRQRRPGRPAAQHARQPAEHRGHDADRAQRHPSLVPTRPRARDRAAGGQPARLAHRLGPV